MASRVRFGIGGNRATDASQLSPATESGSNQQMDEALGDFVRQLGGADAHRRVGVAMLCGEGVVTEGLHLFTRRCFATAWELHIQVCPNIGRLAVRETKAAIRCGVETMRVPLHERTVTKMAHGILDYPSGRYSGLDDADARLDHAVG